MNARWPALKLEAGADYTHTEAINCWIKITPRHLDGNDGSSAPVAASGVVGAEADGSEMYSQGAGQHGLARYGGGVLAPADVAAGKSQYGRGAGM
jgi:hypothetical protein